MELGDGRFLGYCGIRPLQLDEPEVELAWHVKKGMWGQGLGTEAAQAALRLGLNRFGLPSLVAMIHPENAPSLRIAKRLGMARERQLMHFGQPTILYRTSRQPLHTPIA
jgi:RimJ/RimL family protein N-acetyltransferase